MPPVCLLALFCRCIRKVSDAVLNLRLKRFDVDNSAILGGIDLRLGDTDTLALVGPSGVGKTTLLRIIAGLETGFDGQCDVRGRVGMVFQEPTLLPWRSLRDNIAIPTGIPDAQAMHALEEVGLDTRAAAFPNQLSLGQQRRLALARAFALQPDLLLLDEPFVSLDAGLADDMMTLFAKMKAARRVATILVTHVDTEVQRLADRCVRLGGSPACIIEDTKTPVAGTI